MTHIPSLDEVRDLARVRECLAFIAANPDKCPTHWRESVYAEARELGILPEQPAIGQNCKPFHMPRNWLFGGDMEDVF